MRLMTMVEPVMVIAIVKFVIFNAMISTTISLLKIIYTTNIYAVKDCLISQISIF